MIEIDCTSTLFMGASELRAGLRRLGFTSPHFDGVSVSRARR
jgi:hypothetical protein